MTEVVTFRFNFTSTYVKTPPAFAIMVNSVEIYPTTTVTDNYLAVVDIELPCDRRESVLLEIKRSGFDGANEQMLNLTHVSVDHINLEKIWHSSEFHPTYPEPWISEQREQGIHWPEFHHGWRSIGWNGTWVLQFQTPIYTWLLENV